MRRRWGIIATALLVIVGGVTVSIATGHDGWLHYIEAKLGIQPALSAQAQAALQRVEAMAKSGQISESQAQQLEARIRSGDLPGAGTGSGSGGRYGGGRGGFGGSMGLIAQDLGLNAQTLFQDLSQGTTLAKIISSQGKSAATFEAQVRAQLKSQLDAEVKQGALTASQESSELSQFKTQFQRLLDGTWQPPQWQGPGGSGGNAGSGSTP